MKMVEVEVQTFKIHILEANAVYDKITFPVFIWESIDVIKAKKSPFSHKNII